MALENRAAAAGKRRILIVEVLGTIDPVLVAGLVQAGGGYDAARVQSPRAARELLKGERFDGVIIDVSRSFEGAFDLIESLAERAHDAALVVITPAGVLAREVRRYGADVCISKDALSLGTLRDTLDEAILRRRADRAEQRVSPGYSRAYRRLAGQLGRSVEGIAESLEGLSLELFEPDLRHAERERLALIIGLEVERLRDSIAAVRENGTAAAAAGASLDLGALVRSLELLGQHRAEQRGIAFRLSVSYPIPWGMEAEWAGVYGVICDVLDEVFRHTDRGAVSLAVGYDAAASAVVVSVVDTRGALHSARQRAVFEAVRLDEPSGSLGGEAARLGRLRRGVIRCGGEIALAGAARGGSLWTIRLPGKPLTPWIHSAQEGGTLPRHRGALMPVESPARCLIADPGVLTRLTLSRLLRACGASTATVAHGVQVLELLKRERFDRLFIDVEDGLMKDPYLRQSLRRAGFEGQIVGLTAHPSSRREAALPVRLHGLLAKPIGRAQLRQLLERLEGAEGALPEGVSEAPVEAAAAPATPAAKAEAELALLIAEYARSLPHAVNSLARSVERGDWSAVRESAHRLKAAGAFGFRECSAAVRVIERHLAAGAFEEVARAVERLQTIVSAPQPALAESCLESLSREGESTASSSANGSSAL